MIWGCAAYADREWYLTCDVWRIADVKNTVEINLFGYEKDLFTSQLLELKQLDFKYDPPNDINLISSVERYDDFFLIVKDVEISFKRGNLEPREHPSAIEMVKGSATIKINRYTLKLSGDWRPKWLLREGDESVQQQYIFVASLSGLCGAHTKKF